MSKRLFGTDGIRGKAGEFPLDAEAVSRLGGALIRLLKESGRSGRVILGCDTRESSPPICHQLVAGIRGAGGEANLAGVLPTPGVAFLTRADGFDAGLVISASHNPYQDNGIKVFQANGTKLPDTEEMKVEAMILDESPASAVAAETEEVSIDTSLGDDYVDYLLANVNGVDLAGTRVVIDCANGASSHLAPRLFNDLGVDAVYLSNKPDGKNINQGCGSLHPDTLSRAVVEAQAAMGLAFDGDADRCLAVDDSGRVLDGDFILYLLGRHLHRQGQLRNDVVVATVMSNLWLEQHFARDGIRMLRTPVGDKYVLEEMERGGHVLGGEQSGHIIFRDRSTTGDGLLTGLMLLATWKQDGRRLSEMIAGITPCPQILVNVRVKTKPKLEEHPELGPALRGIHEQLGNRGRLLVRYSGTEPLARVMTEGDDAAQIERTAQEVAALLQTHLA